MNIEKFPKVTVILRGYTYSQTRTVVKNLVGTCLGSVEITMNTPGALESIRKISQEFGAQIMVGAGTVLTYEEAVEAIEAGAAFLLSPTVFEKRILDLCRERGVVSVPGAFSAGGSGYSGSGRGGYCEDIPCRQAGEQICVRYPGASGENAADGRGGHRHLKCTGVLCGRGIICGNRFGYFPERGYTE